MADRVALFTRGRFAAVETIADDIPAIAGSLRPGDLAEIEAAGFESAQDAIAESVSLSPLLCLTMLEAGQPIAICGVAGILLSQTGRPWMLGAGALNGPAAQRALLAFSRSVVGMMRSRYFRLENWADARYAAAIRWIAWMEFTLDPPAPHGVHGELFHHFWWERR